MGKTYKNEHICETSVLKKKELHNRKRLNKDYNAEP